MAAPKFNKPEGLAALINAAVHAAKNPGIGFDTDSFNWQEILRDFQEYNCVNFSADNFADRETVQIAFDKWKNKPDEKAPVKCKVEGCKRSADKSTGLCFEHFSDDEDLTIRNQDL